MSKKEYFATDKGETGYISTDYNYSKYWYNKDGQLHREDGPAVEHADETKQWYKNGLLHRDDGHTRLKI